MTFASVSLVGRETFPSVRMDRVDHLAQPAEAIHHLHSVSRDDVDDEQQYDDDPDLKELELANQTELEVEQMVEMMD